MSQPIASVHGEVSLPGSESSPGKQEPAAAPSPGPWGGGSSRGGWSKSPAPNPCSLTDVMSEELVKSLQVEDEKKMSPTKPVESASGGVVPADLPVSSDGFPNSAAVLDVIDRMEEKSAAAPVDDETDSDLLMAQLLQLEYDREADASVKKAESQYNGTNKIQLSFNKYRQLHPALRQEGDNYDDEEDEDDWLRNDGSKSNGGSVGNKTNRRGYTRDKAGGAITTKHDALASGRANTSRSIDTLSAEVAFGDAESFDMKLPNRAYNDLRVHSMHQARRAARLHEKKDHSTATQAIDPKTKLLLYKLVEADVLANVNGVISSGKESVVLHADGGQGRTDGEEETREIPKECAIKVFKTTLTGFKNRQKYVQGDFVFSKDAFKKQSSRKVMRIWAEKEMLNLKRMRRAGICCPQPVLIKQHALIMSFIGQDGVAAPKVKVAQLSANQFADAYDQCLSMITTLYQTCKLVHGDLSEYNMLWHEGKVWFIDVSQSCDLGNPNAHTFLLRDCSNVCRFFRDAGVEDVTNEYDLFNEVTGLGLKGQGQEFLVQIQEYEKKEVYISLGQQRSEYAFDYLFNKSRPDNQDEDDDDDGEEEEDDDVDEEDDDDVNEKEDDDEDCGRNQGEQG